MPLTIGVLLAGCGRFDGSEVHEAVLTLLALDRRGCAALACAPAAWAHVVDHRTGEADPLATRSVLAESARLVRDEVRDLAGVRAEEMDGLVLPGGFGAVRTLSDFAVAGADASVHPEVARLVREVHQQGKPIAALCIAPVVLALVLRRESPILTVGDHGTTADAIETVGAAHVRCPADDVVVDKELKLVTSPAYMLARRISEAWDSVDRAVGRLVDLATAPSAEPDVATADARRR
jgi:enhancing lycopene biosynthesis protein 2